MHWAILLKPIHSQDNIITVKWNDLEGGVERVPTDTLDLVLQLMITIDDTAIHHPDLNWMIQESN